MSLNLFALTSDPSKRIVKFELSSDVQNDLTTYIKSQEATFDQHEEEIEFDGKYKPDEGEVLFIDGYDDIDDLSSAVENPLSAEVVDPTEDFFSEIKALFTGYTTDCGDVKILLQNFDRRRIISTNGLSIFHSSNVYKKIEGIGLTIDHKLTATLENGKLKFFSFHNTRQMFDLSEYYKVATDDDVTEFAALDIIKSENTDELIEMSDSWVRRKISLIQQSGILQNVPINEMKAVAIEFNIPFLTEIDGAEEVIKLPDNKSDLKKLLRFLDEDYYKSPLSNTAFVTNSKRAVGV
ncbi:Kiwa anti-phage protein KwaB-like domain-containing protein [Ferrimonas kyonanensis]|uniref:Kiwa anti-phage protein KwaB-like domain-containing protein n=1 Tax=Ferrimonas kyonanensis TaxID=364763 RepID=UPI00040B6581|nr:Kiwa anti-phage protein KwaB-like domain-containing protein [Ferrimonas kyonanensis]